MHKKKSQPWDESTVKSESNGRVREKPDTNRTAWKGCRKYRMVRKSSRPSRDGMEKNWQGRAARTGKKKGREDRGDNGETASKRDGVKTLESSGMV